MSYTALVCEIRVRPHPNADKVQLGDIRGQTVVVGTDVKSGDLGVFFEDGGQLSESFCKQHDLIARKDSNGAKVGGGYFSESRRVRVQAFRGVKSEGYWVPIGYLSYTKYDISKLRDGDTFTELNKVEICRKYYSQATLAKLARQNLKASKVNKTKVMMPEHNDTAQFMYANLHKNDLIYVTLKTHGTSVRYGLVDVIHKLPTWKELVNKLLKVFSQKKTLEYRLGTRRVILSKSGNGYLGGYYGDGQPYVLAETLLKDKLKPNEIVYGEILGYCPNGQPLFTAKTKGDKSLEAKYGQNIVYTYGCIDGQARFQVYRIVQNGVELSWNQAIARCKELDVEPVLEFGRLVFDGNRAKLDEYIDSLLEGEDPLDSRHPREGVCIRVESPVTGTKIYKSKSWTFKWLENLVKDDDNNVDIEEIA